MEFLQAAEFWMLITFGLILGIVPLIICGEMDKTAMKHEIEELKKENAELQERVRYATRGRH